MAHTPRMASENAARTVPPLWSAARNAPVMSSTRVSIGGAPPGCSGAGPQGARSPGEGHTDAMQHRPLEGNQHHADQAMPNGEKYQQCHAPQEIDQPTEHRLHAIHVACLPEGQSIVKRETRGRRHRASYCGQSSMRLA